MAPPHQQDGAVMTMAASEASPNFNINRNMINAEKHSVQSAMEAPIHLFRSKLPDITIPDHLPLPEYCLEHSRNFPEKPCLIETSKNGRTLTYGDVEVYSKRIAAGLSQLGIKQHDVVMLMIPNSVEFVLLFLGAASIGAIITTCNPFYKEGEIEKQVKGSRAKLIVTQLAHVEKISHLASQHNLQVIVIDDYDKFHSSSLHDNILHVSTLLNASEDECPRVDIHPEDVVALPFSSGTTGLPKGVMLSHKGLVTSTAQQVDGDNPNMNFTADDVILCVLPMFHIYSLSIVLCCLRVGASLAIMPKFEIEALFDVVQRYRVSIAPLVPPIVLALTKNPLVEKYDLSSIRMVMSGAAPLGKDLQDAFKARVPSAIIAQGYGMTEAGSVLSMSLAFAKHPFPVKSGSCGTVLRNAVVKLIDPETGVSLGYNQPGEICIKGSQIMKGYLNDDVATQNTIDKDGFLHTGDIGIIDDDDELFIVDRVKEIIKYKGFQVAPAELEGILLSHPCVFDAACVPKKDESAGEIPIAFVVLTQGAQITELELKEFVSNEVVFYKKLHKIIFVDSIPKSPSGKILRRELRKRLEEGNM